MADGVDRRRDVSWADVAVVLTRSVKACWFCANGRQTYRVRGERAYAIRASLQHK